MSHELPRIPDGGLAELLRTLHISQHGETLAKHGFESIENISLASEEDLVRTCEIPLGHARKILARFALPREAQRSPLVTEYACAICMELLVSPRTLPCGHTFCGHCLEFWISKSEASLCPIDRKPLPPILPDVCVLIQECIRNHFPEENSLRNSYVSAIRSAHILRELMFVFTRHSQNATMIRSLRNDDTILRTEEIEAALLALPRGEFVPFSMRDDIYSVQPSRILALEFNVSAPNMHTFCLEALAPRLGDAFLDVGVGTGIVAALAAQLVGVTGRVHGIDVTTDIVEFARRNIDTQEMRTERIRRQHEEYAGSFPCFLPGCIFSGTSCEAANPLKLFQTKLVIDARTGPTTFTARLVTQTLASTVTFARGTIVDGCAVRLEEETVFYTRADRVPWLPCEYALRYTPEKGNVLSGVYGHPCLATPKATGKVTLQYDMCVWKGGPVLSNIELFVGNVFHMAHTEWEHMYDRIHVGAACDDPDRLDDLCRLLKPGGIMMVPMGNDLVRVTRREGSDEIVQDKLLPVRYGSLLPPGPSPLRPALHPRGRLFAPERFAAPATQDETAVSFRTLCCRKPIVFDGQVMEGMDKFLGERMSCLPHSSVVFCHAVEPTAVQDSPMRPMRHMGLLEADIQFVLCSGCGLHLGGKFVSEPEQRASLDETYVSKYALVREFLESPTALDPREITCKCGAVLSDTAQVVSTNHVWTKVDRPVREPAAMVNSLRKDSIKKGDPREVELGQGRMVCTPVFCSGCASEIGWEFSKCVHLADLPNLIWYCGRFGLIVSAVSGIETSVRAGHGSENFSAAAALMQQFLAMRTDEDDL